MSLEFPIVKIDRTTAQEMLPIFINKGIFSNYDTLRSKEDILEEKKKELGTESLTPEQMREVLSTEGKYKTKNCVIRDYGDYVIAFSAKLYSDYVPNENIDDAMEQIRLHKLGHRIATIILSEAYAQKKLEDLVISKDKLLMYLGYTSNQKHIYDDISEVMFSLRWLNYQIYKFKNKTSPKVKSKALGNFIYHLEDDGKNYKISINNHFLGCIEFLLINDENRTEEEKKSLFDRGYYDYPTSLLPYTKNYSTPAYLLAHFLILDSGNAKLNNKDHKVVAYKLSRFVSEARITYSKPCDQVREVLKAISEISIIERIGPSIENLTKYKSKMALETVVHIYLKKSIKDIDEQLCKQNA